MGEQENIPGDQLVRRTALRVIQQGRPAEYDVIGDFAALCGLVIEAPRRAEEATVIDPPAHRIEPIETSLEDVFIHMMSGAEDNMRVGKPRPKRDGKEAGA